LTSGDVAGRFGLTLRQAEVAILLARGARNDTVALALGVSASTARRHTEAVLARLAVRSRSEVAAVLSARQEGGEAA
jgi:DNA-binding CsgD family transcriptional regulator